MTATPRRRTALATSVLFAATLFAAVGCGNQKPADHQESTPTTAEHGSFPHCLTEHGVTETAVSPAGPPAGVDQGTWDKAMQACSTLAPGPAGP